MCDYMTDEEIQREFGHKRVPPVCCLCKFWEEHEPPIYQHVEVALKSGETLKNKVAIWDGQCHANPPTFNAALDDDAGTDIGTGHFPITGHWEWCGKFESKITSSSDR